VPQLYPYRIFISHAWEYNNDYYTLEKMLNEYPNFSFHNYSVPKHDPLETETRLKSKLLDQIKPTQVVLIIAGMYAAHSKWIQFEIDESKRLEKPIIGIRPWGAQRIPSAVEDAANVMLGWNAKPIIDSIRSFVQ
jgi:hypothetical protein